MNRELIAAYLNGEVKTLTNSEQKELARIALASLTAEPVAGEARFKEEHHWSPCTAAHVAMVLENPADWPNYEVRYLYTAPPAPVVPDEMTMADAIMEIDAKDADRWTGRIGFQKGWNACRAAMLDNCATVESRNHAGCSPKNGSKCAAMLQGSQPVSNRDELPEEKGASLQLRNLIRQRHAEWSDATFGNVGPVGPLKHLSKEALEAAAEPDDLSEWADM